MPVEENGKEIVTPDEEVQTPSSEGNDGGGDTMTSEEIKAMQDENAALKSSKVRLENESKENKRKYQTQVAAEANAKKQKLIDEGKTEELLEAEKVENERIRGQLVNSKARNIRTALENEILKLAPNCHDVTDVINNLDPEKYSIDTESETVLDVSAALTDVQKRKPFLFSGKKMPASYSGNPPPTDDPKGKKMTYKEYCDLPTKKAMQEAAVSGLVEGL